MQYVEKVKKSIHRFRKTCNLYQPFPLQKLEASCYNTLWKHRDLCAVHVVYKGKKNCLLTHRKPSGGLPLSFQRCPEQPVWKFTICALFRRMSFSVFQRWLAWSIVARQSCMAS